MTNPNVNPSPKSRFQESQQNVSHHRELIQRNEFQRACDFGLLQYQGQLASMDLQGNMNNAAANHLKITGVIEFLHVLRHLGETAQQGPKIVDRDNLIQPP